MAQEFITGRGLDIGTSFIIAAREMQGDAKVQYSKFRDAFFRMKPSTPIAKKMMEKGLKGQEYFTDVDGSFVVVGQDAIERAIERNQSASRPLVRGVIAPREKQARRILRHIIKEILGEPLTEGEKVAYSVPAQPIDEAANAFDVGFHCDALNNDIAALGFTPAPISEAEAICYSELENDDYTGIALSFGAGMVNVCLMSSGEGILHWSTTRSGDWIDSMAGQASASPDTIVQVEKEGSKFVVGTEVSNSTILSAISLYYVRLIDYTVEQMINKILRADNLPKFTSPLPIIISGGTSQADGFIPCFQKFLDEKNQGSTALPFKVKEVRSAKDPLLAVARGCLLASQL